MQGEAESWHIERLNLPHKLYTRLKEAGIETIGQAAAAMGEDGASAEAFAARFALSRAAADDIRRQIAALNAEAGEEQARTVRLAEQKCTLADLAASDAAWITPEKAACVLGCAASTLRTQAKENPAALGFAVVQLGTVLKIPRAPFVEYMMHGTQGTPCAGAEHNYTASVKFGRYPATGGVGIETQGNGAEIMQLLTDGVLEMLARQAGIKNVRDMTKTLCAMMSAKAEAMSSYADIKSAWADKEMGA